MGNHSTCLVRAKLYSSPFVQGQYYHLNTEKDLIYLAIVDEFGKQKLVCLRNGEIYPWSDTVVQIQPGSKIEISIGS